MGGKRSENFLKGQPMHVFSQAMIYLRMPIWRELTCHRPCKIELVK